MYKRIVLKLSGEALAGPRGFGLDAEKVSEIAGELAEIHELGVELGIVVGGGNIFRGVEGQAREMDRVSADSMGMLSTVINAIALQDAVEKLSLIHIWVCWWVSPPARQFTPRSSLRATRRMPAS